MSNGSHHPKSTQTPKNEAASTANRPKDAAKPVVKRKA